MKNEMDHTAIDILLASYFSGEADETERAQVELWKTASEENNAYFGRSKKAWDASAHLLSDARFDTDAAWKKLSQKIHGDETSAGKRNYSWAIAAGVLLILGVTTLLWLMKGPGMEAQHLVLTSSAEVVHDTLSDGSVISLNRNSQLEYPSQFDGDKREVSLRGEAFFNVAHDAKHPFIIHTNMMEVKVLGTSFNVCAYTDDSVRVSVETGKVQCVSDGDTVVIVPGQYAVYDKGSGRIRVGKEDDPNRSAYRNRIFHFNDTPLSSVVQQLNAAYGCNIILKNEQLKTCRFSSTKVFNNEPVGNIIEAIEVTFGISSQSNGTTIVLDGTGCK